VTATKAYWYQNAMLRAAVTTLAKETWNGVPAQKGPKKHTAEVGVEGLWPSPARYPCAMLLARIYESAPLVYPKCQMLIPDLRNRRNVLWVGNSRSRSAPECLPSVSTRRSSVAGERPEFANGWSRPKGISYGLGLNLGKRRQNGR